MRRRTRLVVAAALAAMVLALSGTAHSGVPFVVAGPNAAVTGYATPVVVIDQGEQVTFGNIDGLVTHDVVSADLHPTGNASWCSMFPSGGCPLFGSEETGAGLTPVHGTTDLAPGTYNFYCNPHPWMTGRIVVLAA